MSNRDRDGQRQAWGEQWQPPALLQLLVVIGGHVLDPEGQTIAQTPHLIAPAALDASEGQPGQVRVLLIEQFAKEPFGDLNHDTGC